jgi:hypothetical protein
MRTVRACSTFDCSTPVRHFRSHIGPRIGDLQLKRGLRYGAHVGKLRLSAINLGVTRKQRYLNDADVSLVSPRYPLGLFGHCSMTMDGRANGKDNESPP